MGLRGWQPRRGSVLDRTLAPACRAGPGVALWYVRPRQRHMISFSGLADDRGCAKTLAMEGVSVERVTGIEPACQLGRLAGQVRV
jgi:hypothetical protein